MTATRIETGPTLSSGWRRGRGPLTVLPALLFRDRRAVLTILVGWALTFAGSSAIGYLLTRIAPGTVGPDLGDAPPAVLWGMIALFSPVVETLLMAGILSLLLRWLRAWQAVVASAALWGVLHSLMAPLWGAVIWWPFLIFSTVYVTWRPRGPLRALAIVAAIHMLQNGLPATAMALGY